MINNKRRIIKKSNNYVLSKYALSTNEQKIILLCISKIKQNPTDMDHELIFNLEVKEIQDFLGYSSKRIYEELHKMGINLATSIVEMPNDKNEFDIFSPFPDTAYKNGEFTIKFSKRLNSELLNLTSKFTYYFLDCVKELSSYSLRLYEILKSYQYQGKLRIPVEDLKEKMGIIIRDRQNNKIEDKYKAYGDFKRRVLTNSLEEIRYYTDIQIEIEEIKKSRKITELKFIISTKIIDSASYSLPEVAITSEIDEIGLINDEQLFDMIDECRKFLPVGISTAGIKQLIDMSENNVDLIREKHELSKKQKKIDNIVGWLITAIAQDFQVATIQNNVSQNKFNDFPQRECSGDYFDKFEAKMLGKNNPI